ncbi:PREDICTED: serine/threonine-protein kinase PEPKR2 [Tarenaya hassleriana]|uniref:serine/threonine-protein kinase PEPKR2 n=1 Tax=Tarenaya hassleriana TaxID=28532 RepID=UPI00053C8D1F|nr:PREDICTED: serine/threonine-protein kinase PEPKR2 [Tarenaya hassleriana]XP_010520773.1 PREDICTED: serine/threonine-protein kinase PEPKR2 [Tarenaya hassleriana]
MRKKRKGSEAEGSENILENLTSATASRSSNLRSHFSLEDYCRLKKRCKENDAVESAGSFKRRLAGVATAPPCGASSLVPPGRGLKRKIGCIDASTQTGRKNNIHDDYVSGPTIGQGKFGSVWICRSRSSGMEFACKTLQKGEETVHREVEIMQHLSGHPGVVTLHAVYEEIDCFHLVMELCSRGRLIDEMVKEGRHSEQRTANIFKDLMLAISYCHEMGVVHRDIKPENILLTAAGKIKVADFGLAMRIAKGQTLSGLAGSPAYVAPEVLSGNYSEKVDIWSAGVLLYALLSGVLPFQGDSLEAIFEAIKNVKLDLHSGVWESVSKPARDLLARMLTRDVSVRITADEVLRHPWILFYTDRTLKTLCIKSKHKNQAGSPLCLLRSSSKTFDLDGTDPISSTSFRVNSLPLSPSGNSDSNTQEEDESGFVDVLVAAIADVRISEPKRSRICGPNGPIEQQHSSNLTANTLCRAF